MQPAILTARCLTQIPLQFHSLSRNHSNPHLKSFSSSSSSSSIICFTSVKKPRSCRLLTLCSSAGPKSSDANCETVAKNRTEEEALTANLESQQEGGWRVEVGNPNVPPLISTAKLSPSDQAFFLLAFIACTTSAAFVSLVIAAVPTLYAMGKAAISLSKLADTAREELPSTMAAIRLSGMEISDLTLELSDLRNLFVKDSGKDNLHGSKGTVNPILRIQAVAFVSDVSVLGEHDSFLTYLPSKEGSVVALKEDEYPLMSYCDIGFHFLELVEKTMDNIGAIHGSTEDLYAWKIAQLAYTVSHLLQEIADGVSKSAQAVQAAKAGIRKVGSFAQQQTVAMIQERANLPSISLQPVVAGAAKKTSRAVGQATKNFINMISGGEDGLYSVVALKEDEYPLMSYCDIGFHFLELVEKTMDNIGAIHGSTGDLYAWKIAQLAYKVSHLLQEIADGVSKSAQAVQAAKAGIRKVGSFAQQQTVAMIQERANLPSISLQPVVAGAAKKTSRAVGQATKNFINMISGGEVSSENQNENIIHRIEN
ncbi:hypothetical protein RHSIM_Rhsim02G0173800 [Rhododendron simsii]|uniref:Uncharacterized protein n=1 Tax=Rhododendron simsii TaxID=118357 RepID=A0A834LS35_RHOSS|nr:hypothetical protein RHSIM_Rhsim02G0173800 [Rhododendron simsii]